jgi:hypothetical protein
MNNNEKQLYSNYDEGIIRIGYECGKRGKG